MNFVQAVEATAPGIDPGEVHQQPERWVQGLTSERVQLDGYASLITEVNVLCSDQIILKYNKFNCTTMQEIPTVCCCIQTSNSGAQGQVVNTELSCSYHMYIDNRRETSETLV